MTDNEVYTLRPEGDFLVTEVSGITFGFRKWTWGEKNALSTACATIHPSGVVLFDNAKYNTGIIEKTVFKKEGDNFVPLSSDEINKLDGKLGERLFRITRKLNIVESEETVNL